jgi:HAD superfamily hydrolase (TIGR01490 family)
MAEVVFSDMEGTLTGGSAPRLFVQIGARLGIFSRWEVLKIVAINLLSKPLPKLSPLRSKIYYYGICGLVKGHTVAEMEQISEVLAEELVKLVKPTSLELLQEYRRAGRSVVIVSAGGHEGIMAFARKLGVARGEGTKMEHKNGVYTGRGLGLCQGALKAARVQEVAAELGCELSSAYGFGDTFHDLSFLSLLGHPAVIDPDPKLEAEARQRGWPVINTNMPVSETLNK